MNKKMEASGKSTLQKTQHPVLEHYNYHIWANQKVFDRLKELPRDVYTQEIVSVFPSLSEVMSHMLIFDNVWYGVIAEASFEAIMAEMGKLRNEIQGINIEEMESRYQDLNGQYKRLLEQQEHLDRAMTVTHPQYGPLDTLFSELVHHVCNHGTAHRGHISAMLRQIGHAGTPTDYVFYLFAKQNSTI
jgi:uncharacterized damage-inducible protein DinB